MLLAVGLIIGAILGLTGAGGAAFALPLLILVVGVPVQQALGLSLATVALAAGYGAARRLRSGDIFWRAVILLSSGGVLAAPLGKYFATFLPDAWLLTGFTLLCIAIAVHMWRRCALGPSGINNLARSDPTPSEGPWSDLAKLAAPSEGYRLQIFVQPGPTGAVTLAFAGLGVGALSGLFGIGGGFLIVPLLVSLMGIGVRQAIATSLVIITLISSAGFVTHTLILPPIDWLLELQLGVGAVSGMYLGSRVAERCSPNVLQKSFSIALLILASVTLARTALGGL